MLFLSILKSEIDTLTTSLFDATEVSTVKTGAINKTSNQTGFHDKIRHLANAGSRQNQTNRINPMLPNGLNFYTTVFVHVNLISQIFRTELENAHSVSSFAAGSQGQVNSSVSDRLGLRSCTYIIVTPSQLV